MNRFQIGLLLGLLLVGASPVFGASACPPDSHWVRPHHRRAYVRADGSHVSATSVVGHCQKNPPGYAFWKDRLKSGLPVVWPLVSEAASRWTPEEIERIFDALSKLPDALFLSSIKGLYRMQKSRDFPNPASSSSGVIVLYDNAFDGKRNLSRILGHELAHEYFREMPRKAIDSYQLATGWDNIGTEGQPPVWIARNKESFVEADGFTTPAEDFANNVEYFLFDRAVLKKVTPKADLWIDRHFGSGFKLRKESK